MTPRLQERWSCLKVVGGRECVSIQCLAGEISLSGFYLHRRADTIHKCFARALSNHRRTLCTSSVTQTSSDYQLLTFDPLRCRQTYRQPSLVTKSISPSLLLLQSCLRVGSAYDTERRVCSAVFAFQMAHEVSCSSSTWISPQEKKASVIHYYFFFSPFEKQCRFRNKHSIIHSSVIFSLFPTRLRSCVW